MAFRQAGQEPMSPLTRVDLKRAEVSTFFQIGDLSKLLAALSDISLMLEDDLEESEAAAFISAVIQKCENLMAALVAAAFCRQEQMQSLPQRLQ